MGLKRQLFVPGRRIEQIGKLAEQPFFARRTGDSHGTTSDTTHRRPLLSRLAENAGALFSLTLSLVLVVALAALVFAFVRELRKDSVLLETFVAPKDLVERGYTSTVIAEKMLDEIRAINAGSTSVRTRRALEYGDALPDIQIAHGGLSMKSIVRYARRLFDLPDASIGGEILRQGAALRMTIRSRDRSGTELLEVGRSDDDVEALLRDAGRAIFRATDPYILASFLYNRESNAGSETFPETLAAIDYVLAHPPASDDAWALNLRGNVRTEQGRNEEAIADYRAAIARDGHFRGNLAKALLAVGRRDEAMKFTREMLARSDVEPGERVDLGTMLLEDGDIRGATEIAREMANRRQQREIVWRGLELLATSLNLSHRHAESLEVIARYEQIHGVDPDALTMRALAYARLGRPEQAMDTAARVQAMQPDSRSALWARGNALAAAGRYDDAAADFVRLIDKYPDHKCALARLGYARLAQGYPSAAIAAFERHENSARIYGYRCAAQADFGWGLALDAAGKPADAVKKFASAAARDPDDVALWRAWAAALDKLGRRDEAAAKLEEARRAEARLAVPLKLD